MKLKKVWLFLSLLMSVSVYAFAGQDIVYLQDGSVIHGNILEMSKGKLKFENNNGDILVYKMTEVLKLVKDPQDQNSQESDQDNDSSNRHSEVRLTSSGTYEEKSPVEAGLLSWVLPGVGQYYNNRPEDITKGIIVEGAVVTGIVLIVAGDTITTTYTTENYYGYSYSSPTYSYDSGLVALGFVLYVGADLFGIVDAIMSADDINKHHSKQTSRDFNINLASLTDSSSRLIPTENLSLNF